MELLYRKMLASKGPKIIGVAKNYLGPETTPPSSPIIFQKPLSSVITSKTHIRIPQGTKVVHEVELGVLIKQKGSNVSLDRASDLIGGYCLALDMTASDIIAEAKKEGLSWDIGKGYDTFLPLSEYLSPEKVKDPHNLDIQLTVNGELRQKANTKDLYFKIPFLIHYLSTIFSFVPGDLILTGTPGGISQVNPGDVLEAKLEEEGSLLLEDTFKVSTSNFNTKVSE